MAVREIPSPELLRQLFHYESDTGKLFWRPRPRKMFKKTQPWGAWNTRFAGKEAGGFYQGSRYQIVAVGRRLFLAHRIAWAIHYGEWPLQHIDHINGDPFDNRIENLRDCGPSENAKNMRMREDNTSGVTGVRWDRRRKRWGARIKSKGKETHLGYFDTIEEAAAARASANTRFGFTERHGLSAID